MRHSAWLAIAVLAVTPLACKKQEAAPPPAAPAAPAAPTPPAPPVPDVATIELGRHLGENKRVSDTTSTFALRDTLYLSVVTTATNPQSVLTAVWRFQTGQRVDSTAQQVAPPSPSDPATVTEFHLTRPKAWPVGKYTVEVFLDGASKGKREFEVKR